MKDALTLTKDVPVFEKVEKDKETVVDLTSDNEEEAKPERIRGGGLPEQNSTLLIDYPKETWIGKGVFGKCMTTLSDNTETGEDIFLGRIEARKDNGDCDVSIIYVSKSGYLPTPIVTSIHHDQLRIIENESDKRILAGSIDAGMKVNHQSEKNSASQQCASPSKPIHTSHNRLSRHVPNYAKAKYSANRSRKEISLKNAALMFIDRLTHRTYSSSPLGILPDGKLVCWFQSDPRAIYIRLRNNSQKEMRSIQLKYKESVMRWTEKRSEKPYLHVPSSECFCCPWGCSVDVDVDVDFDEEKKTIH